VSAALRFNPYSLDLWLLAAYYESEVNANPFKGRKIFYKALKLNQKTVVNKIMIVMLMKKDKMNMNLFQ